MRARDHTERMLAWWQEVGIDHVDLALRRPGDVWLWHRAVSISELPRFLPWARAENVRRAEVYARPARGSSWPVVFLDDLPTPEARKLAARHPALCVRTSSEGGCQLWLRSQAPLDEQARYRLQQALARLLGADVGSVSGEHLGRLAGFRNWKRDGPWVNVLDATRRGDPLADGCLTDGRRFHPPTPLTSHATPRPIRPRGPDTSASGREWGWVMGALKAGHDPDDVYRRLVDHARPRRGADAQRYARHTLDQALNRLT